jgi:hypothetical protein
MLAVLLGEINTQTPVIDTFLWVILGGVPNGSGHIAATFIREYLFPDGVAPWLIAAFLFASNTIPDEDLMRRRIAPFLSVVGVAILASMVSVFVRLFGGGIFADLVRLPFFVAPYALAVNGIEGFRVVRNTPLNKLIRFSAYSFAALMLYRLIIAITFVVPVTFTNMLGTNLIDIKVIQWLITSCILVVSSAVYMLLHTALVTYYAGGVAYAQIEF